MTSHVDQNGTANGRVSGADNPGFDDVITTTPTSSRRSGSRSSIEHSKISLNDSVRQSGRRQRRLETADKDPGIHVYKAGYSRTPSKGTITTDTKAGSEDRMFEGDENEERGNWSGRFDFLLSLLGYAVGLGNVWRFPYLCYRNGGGAFLLPFVIMMFIIGVPLFFMEACLGQFCSSGPMTCWKFAPLFKGVGISMVAVSAFTALYYNVILTWSYFYFFASFTGTLPWTTCTSKDCSLNLPMAMCVNQDEVKNPDGTCTNGDDFLGLWNVTVFQNATGRTRISPAEEYFNDYVLELSDSVGNFGSPRWKLVLCLLFAWIICFLCLLKGIKTTGKVVYFTAIFPYVVLIILFFRGVTLENAGEGVRFFILPVWERLLDARVWKDAAVQIFFSMSIAGGGLVTLSSYNRFHNNILKDAIIVCTGDTLTCIFAGFVIFSYIGFMAGKLNVPVEDVAAEGAGLAFVVYPDAVTSLPAPPLWSLLFFFMLITLGLDSQFAMLETVLTGVLDQYPHYRPHKTKVILGICVVFFFLGLPFVCPGGMYLLQLMDNYVGGWTLLIIGLFENICIVYVYGMKRFIGDVEVMLGFKLRIYYFQPCWLVISPLTLTALFIFTFVDYTPSTYGDYKYPAWADAIGWLLAFLCISAIPITMIFKLASVYEGSFIENVKFLCTPTRDWGPALIKYRKLITHVDDFVIDPYEEVGTYINKAYSSGNNSRSQSTIYASQTQIPNYYFMQKKKHYSDDENSENSSYVSRKTGVSFESTV